MSYESLLSDKIHLHVLSKLHSVHWVVLNYIQVLFAHLRWGKAAGAEYQKRILVDFSGIDTCVIA